VVESTSETGFFSPVNVGGCFLANPGLPDSLSGYHYTNTRNLIVGAMCAMGILLCAAGILLCALLALVTAIWPSAGVSRPDCCARESGALVFFGIAWYVKGVASDALDHPQLFT
jgi:hypothetical protein